MIEHVSFASIAHLVPTYTASNLKKTLQIGVYVIINIVGTSCCCWWPLSSSPDSIIIWINLKTREAQGGRFFTPRPENKTIQKNDNDRWYDLGRLLVFCFYTIRQNQDICRKSYNRWIDLFNNSFDVIIVWLNIVVKSFNVYLKVCNRVIKFS